MLKQILNIVSLSKTFHEITTFLEEKYVSLYYFNTAITYFKLFHNVHLLNCNLLLILLILFVHFKYN